MSTDSSPRSAGEGRGAARPIEEALRASEMRYRTLAETSAVGIWQVDPAHRTIYLNPAMRALLELDSDEPLPADAFERFFTAESRDTLRYQRAKHQRGLATTFEVEVITKLGTRRALLVTGAPLFGADGRFEGTIGTFADLTERKQMEDALAAEKERLAVTLRSLADAVVATDTDGFVTLMNDGAARLTGWTAADAAGQPVRSVVALSQAGGTAAAYDPLRRVLERGDPLDLAPDAMLRNRAGEARQVAGRVAPMHDAAGRIIGVVAVLRDVTEQRRLEAELAKAAKLESVGVLAGGIAHDFNNILTAVLGNVSLALMETGLPEGLREWLVDAEKAALRARELTQQLLTFAKGGDPVRKAVSLVELVRESAEFARHGAKVRCEYTIEASLWPAEADAGQIGQVVQNLVLNAVQAMEAGGIVAVSARNATRHDVRHLPLAPGEYVVIAVRDQGPGIAPENLARVFDPFFTTKKTGSGLGLATSYAIAKRHNGLLRVESAPGCGATFELFLPARPGAAVESRGGARTLRTMRGRVLFMDDEAVIRRLALNLLHRLGFEAVVVEDGVKVVESYAAAKAEGRPYDVVILDLTVPGGLGGRETLRRLAEIDPDVRVVVSSGYANDPVLAQYREHGFRGAIVKPYELADLASVLDAVLAG